MKSYLEQELLNRQYQKETQARAEKSRFAFQQEHLEKLLSKDNPWLVKPIGNTLTKLWMRLLHRHILVMHRDGDDKSNHEPAYI